MQVGGCQAESGKGFSVQGEECVWIPATERGAQCTEKAMISAVGFASPCMGGRGRTGIWLSEMRLA